MSIATALQDPTKADLIRAAVQRLDSDLRAAVGDGGVDLGECLLGLAISQFVMGAVAVDSFIALARSCYEDVQRQAVARGLVRPPSSAARKETPS
jgi:hypothetical protein